MAYIAWRVFQGKCILSGVDIAGIPQVEYGSKKTVWEWIGKKYSLCDADTLRLGADRSMAWGKLELYWLGNLSWHLDLSVDDL